MDSTTTQNQPDCEGSAASLHRLVRRWNDTSDMMLKAAHEMNKLGASDMAMRAIGCSQTYSMCADDLIKSMNDAPNDQTERLT